MTIYDHALALARVVADHAPLLGATLAGPAGGQVGALIAQAFGTRDDPEAMLAAITRDPEATAKLRAIETTHQAALARMHLEAETAALREVNATMRAELEADDKFRGRWRPTFGYVMAGAFGLQIIATSAATLAGAFIHPQHAGEILNAVAEHTAAQTAIWTVALGVLGVQAYRRSGDKRAAMGHPEPSLVARILGEPDPGARHD